VSEENLVIRRQLEEQSRLGLKLGREIQQVTEQKAELEGRLREAGGAARLNVAVIPVSGEPRVDPATTSQRLTISVNAAPPSPAGEEPAARRKSFPRGPPPAGPASLPALPSAGGSPRAGGKKEVQVFQLEQHCKNLEDQLDDVKFEIVKILTDKADFSKENAVLKNYQQAFSELQLQNTELRRRLEEGGGGKGLLEVPEQVEGKMIPEIDRSSPDGQEREVVEGDAGKAEEEVGRLQERLEGVEEERRVLEGRVARLEESLQLMSGEFESMEDYWQRKLDEERIFYEDQLRCSGEQFQSLEGRMREYEELAELPPQENNSETGSEEDKLSTIEETGSLEAQVTEWEEEIVSLRGLLEEGERERAVLEDQCRARVAAAEGHGREASEQLEELRWRLQEERAAGCECGQGPASSPRGPAGEPAWLQPLPRSSSQAGLASAASFPSSMPVSPRQGPASLPAELVCSAQREVRLNVAHRHSLFLQVRRLQELRRYIQEECDQLLLRKERLREEVAGHDGIGGTVAAGRSVATQAPSSLLGATAGPSTALSSLAQAYKVVADTLFILSAKVHLCMIAQHLSTQPTLH
jgi:hypothetical protein